MSTTIKVILIVILILSAFTLIPKKFYIKTRNNNEDNNKMYEKHADGIIKFRKLFIREHLKNENLIMNNRKE